MLKTVLLAAISAALGNCQTVAQRSKYARFAAEMEPFKEKFKWEPIEMTTDDYYKLTSFLIQSRQVATDKPPVLIHHGEGQDAASWMKSLSQAGTPFPVQLAAEGYPIWMMNGRGTEYSKNNSRIDSKTKAFWDFSITSMWMDLKSNVETMKAQTGYDQLWYIGYSGATTTILYALTTQEFVFRNKVRDAILLAPCTIPAVEKLGALQMWSAGLGINEISGSDWPEDKKKACTVLDEVQCKNLVQYDNLQPTSLKYNAHFSQLKQAGKFQEFVNSWPDVKLGREIDVSNIATVPVSLYVMAFDEVCLPAIAQQTQKNLAKVMSKYEVFYDKVGHRYFEVSNDFAAKLKTHIAIEKGEAAGLLLSAKEYLRRTGGYINPAGEFKRDDSYWALSKTGFTILSAALVTLML